MVSQRSLAESKLSSLVGANLPGNREAIAGEWKAAGGKVIGVMTTYVPEEIIMAAGMLPWRVSGSWSDDLDFAYTYVPVGICGYCMHVLESLLRGEYDSLDGVVSTNWSDDTKRLWDNWVALGKAAFTHLLHVPLQDSPSGQRWYAREVRAMARAVEQFSGVAITEDSLVQAIATSERTRQLLMEVYGLRRRDTPLLTGSEVLGLTTAAQIMPRERFNRDLEELLPYLAERNAPVKKSRPRILVSGDFLDNPAYLELIEEAGCVVAMDDLDTGSRHFWQGVDPGEKDIYDALARGYLTRPECPRMFAWDNQVNQLIQWARDFDIDGVLELRLVRCRPREMRSPYLLRRLSEEGIPATSLQIEYGFSNTAQLRTRVEAFVEMLEARKD